MTVPTFQPNTAAPITAPKNIPTNVPRIETVSAMFASFSPLVLPITDRIIPAGPKTIGRKSKDTAPKTIPSVENVLLSVCFAIVTSSKGFAYDD